MRARLRDLDSGVQPVERSCGGTTCISAPATVDSALSNSQTGWPVGCRLRHDRRAEIPAGRPPGGESSRRGTERTSPPNPTSPQTTTSEGTGLAVDRAEARARARPRSPAGSDSFAPPATETKMSLRRHPITGVVWPSRQPPWPDGLPSTALHRVADRSRPWTG